MSFPVIRFIRNHNRMKKLEKVAELAAALSTSQDCDPAHHELVVMAMEALKDDGSNRKVVIP